MSGYFTLYILNLFEGHPSTRAVRDVRAVRAAQVPRAIVKC